MSDAASLDFPVLDESLRRPLGRTGLTVSPLGYGSAPAGFLETEDDVLARILHGMLDAGVNLIDTAAMYRGAEEAIGRTVSSRRDDYVLVSKCGHEIEETGDPAWSKETIRDSIDRSLRRLKTDVIDVMLLHSCELDVLERGEAIEAVVAARDAGKIRHAGYSGDNDAAAWAARHPELEVIQTSVSVCDQRNLDLVLPAVAEAGGGGVMAKRPIANAAWRAKDERYEWYEKYVAPYIERFLAMNVDLDDDLDLGPLGEKPAKDAWPEVALRFTLSFEGVATAIVGTTRPHHLRDNLAAAANGPLLPHNVERLREAFRRAEPEAGWPGLT